MDKQIPSAYKLVQTILPTLCVLLLSFSLYSFLYRYDNKYTTGHTFGQEGFFSFTQEDLNKPLFLIDGWELYPDRLLSPSDFAGTAAPVPLQYTYLGEFSNFSYFGKDRSPFGKASYRLQLHYNGAPQIVLLEIPEIFSEYTLWINGNKAAATGSGATVAFPIDKTAELILSVENYTHYYSGLVYPPALGTPTVISRMFLFRHLFYGFLCIFPLTLSLFGAAALRRRRWDARQLHFGLLCLFFSLHCAYPFLRFLNLQNPFWYAVEDASWLAMLYEAIQLCTLEAGLEKRRFYRFFIRPVSLAACIVCFVSVSVLLPRFGLVTLYGQLMDIYKLLCWLYLLGCALWGQRTQGGSTAFLLAGGVALGVSHLLNLADNNRFEPIYTGWQIEYAGLLMTVLFWWMLIQRIRRIQIQNEQLNLHLEDLVQQRTAELQHVLGERKAFFSDMAHNLKAPITAIHGFIHLILQENLYLDEELRHSLTLIAGEDAELQRRVGALSQLNAFDRITEPREEIELNALLRQVYEANQPETCISGIYLRMESLDATVFVTGQRTKFLLLFENLIYNAISFTGEEGIISILPHLEGDTVRIDVSDTGCGISPEHLPHIFERFYIGRKNKSEGTGLGLAIVKMIVEEAGGDITVHSVEGEGTTFQITLPVRPAHPSHQTF